MNASIIDPKQPSAPRVSMLISGVLQGIVLIP